MTARSSRRGSRASPRGAPGSWAARGHATMAPVGAPAAVLEADDALVDEHGQELLGEERVALRGLDDPVQYVGVEARRPSRWLDHARLASSSSGSSSIREPRGAAAPVGGRSTSSGAWGRRAAPAPRRSLHEVLDELEERRLGPVDVLDDDDDGPLGREVLQEPAHSPRRAPRTGNGSWVSPIADASRTRDAVAGRVGESGELGVRLLGVVVVHDPRGVPDRLGERPEADAVSVRQAAAPSSVRRPRERPRNSAVSRDFPTPASPTTVTSRGGARATASSKASRSAASSLVPPDQGRSRRTRASTAPHHHADEPIGGHRLGLSLQLERLHLLDRRRRRARAGR